VEETAKRRKAAVTARRDIAEHLSVLRFEHPFAARSVEAGQFVNILPKQGFSDPLLRRPFSIYQTLGDEIEVIVQEHGRGTSILAHTGVGETIDVLGPLGNPWKMDSGDHETAVMLIGGVGVASMPLLTKSLKASGKKFLSYYGARTKDLFADEYLENVIHATDDGSKGYHGTIIEKLRIDIREGKVASPKIFVCGPTPMMRAAMQLAEEFKIPCEVSLETEMACGIGICQGCPVVTTASEEEKSGKKFLLVCTQGPSFERERIRL
jgi:dihydroorotate dehydrogenase electron transfer subunit